MTKRTLSAKAGHRLGRLLAHLQAKAIDDVEGREIVRQACQTGADAVVFGGAVLDVVARSADRRPSAGVSVPGQVRYMVSWEWYQPDVRGAVHCSGGGARCPTCTSQLQQ